jgi:hypothetical protein
VRDAQSRILSERVLMVVTPKSPTPGMSSRVPRRTPRDGVRGWLFDLIVGGGLGGLLGLIVAVNVVIYSGVAGGYEAGLGEVFQHSVVIGLIVVTVLVGGPVLGLLVARRRRRNTTRRRA